MWTLDATGWLVVATIVLAIATVFLAWFTRRQASSTAELPEAQDWPMLVPCQKEVAIGREAVIAAAPHIPGSGQVGLIASPRLHLKNVGQGPALNVALRVECLVTRSGAPQPTPLDFETTDGGSVGAGDPCEPWTHVNSMELGKTEAGYECENLLTIEYTSADGRHFQTLARWTRVGWRDVTQRQVRKRHARISEQFEGL